MARRIVLLTAAAAALILAGAVPAGAIPPPVPDVTQVSSGTTVECVRTASGNLWCQGADNHGQVGNGTQPSNDGADPVRNVPDTGQISAVAQVAAGYLHACARMVNGQARCWGLGTGGQLGNDFAVDALRPVIVVDPTGPGPLTGVQSISAGDIHTCALLTGGRVACWGTNISGQLGDGTTTTRYRPVVVRNRAGTAPLTGVTQLSAGSFHTCVRLSSGQARCWGDNDHGQLGDGTATDRRRPTLVENANGSGPLAVVQLAAGGAHTCATVPGGQARCWGGNLAHQLGTLGPGTADRARPVVVRTAAGATLTGVAQVAAGDAFSCARLTNRQVRCWGDDTEGQIGNGPPVVERGAVPVRSASGEYDPPTPGVPNLTGITQIDAGGAQVCARRQDGRALCWGDGVPALGNQNRPSSFLAAPLS